MPRPKHPRKELESVLRSAERQGWVVTKGKSGYFKMKCSCPDKHMKTISATPSGNNYTTNMLGQLKRATCWTEDR